MRNLDILQATTHMATMVGDASAEQAPGLSRALFAHLTERARRCRQPHSDQFPLIQTELQGALKLNEVVKAAAQVDEELLQATLVTDLPETPTLRTPILPCSRHACWASLTIQWLTLPWRRNRRSFHQAAGGRPLGVRAPDPRGQSSPHKPGVVGLDVHETPPHPRQHVWRSGGMPLDLGHHTRQKVLLSRSEEAMM